MRIGRMAGALFEDCPQFRPVDGACSPFGVIFGTPTNLIEDMALKSLQRDSATGFSLEDVFVDGDPGGERLAWVSGWREMPHVDREVRKLYEYPRQFAADIFERIERALRRRIAAGEAHAGEANAGEAHAGEANAGVRTGRLFVVPADDRAADSAPASIPNLPARYFRSSNRPTALAHAFGFSEQTELLRDRKEGQFLVSFETADGWLGISKDCLTAVLGEGRDARIAGLPDAAAAALALTCPGLVAR
jgi:hypothetical protein